MEGARMLQEAMSEAGRKCSHGKETEQELTLFNSHAETGLQYGTHGLLYEGPG